MELALLPSHSSAKLFRAPWPELRGRSLTLVPVGGGRPALNLRPGGVAGRPAVHSSQVLTMALVGRGWGGVGAVGGGRVSAVNAVRLQDCCRGPV